MINMKKKRILYSLVTVAVIATLAVVISYATDMHPAETPERQAPVVKSTTTDQSAAVKKKSCSCCQERMARARERFRKTRERIRAAQQAQQAKTKVPVSQQTPERASDSP